MPYLALVEEQEIYLADVNAVATALDSGRIDLETWIKDAEVEADWQTVAGLFPQFATPLENGGDRD